MRRPRCLAAPRRPSGSSRSAAVLALAGLAVVSTMAAATSVLWRPPANMPHQPQSAPAHDVLASLPLAFEPQGSGNFVSRGPGYAVMLTPAQAVLGVQGGTFGLRPAGPQSNPAARLTGRQVLPGTINHIAGDDPARWTTGVPTYGTVVAEQVWPGVDMVWHGDQRRLEHDVVVAPGADPAAVALDVEGARSVRIDAGGDLLVDLDGTTARLSRPVVYQDLAGGRRSVAGSYTTLGPARIGFALGSYDRSAPLVIDPVLVTSSTLGGGGTDVGYSIAVDAAGNTYVTGSSESTDFPTATPFQPALAPAASGPSTDVFVTKLSPDGSSVVWSTYLGGKGRDTGYAIAVGPNGSVYVSGVTESADFPRAKAAQDAYGGGPTDAFVARIAPNGSSLEWSTFIGGNQTDRARGLAVDSAGNAYVTGSTSSVNFPAVNAQQPGPYRPDDVDAFLVKLPAAGAPLAFSTRLGGSNDDHGLAVAVDAQGSAYVTGDTLSPGFPTVKPLQAASGGSASGVAGSFPDAFVAKFAPAGSTLVYSTFLGGSDYDQATAIAVDSSGAAYVAGSTNSPNFPTLGALQGRKDNDADAFLSKIDPAGAALVYSTYLGGGGADGANGITLDADGGAYVVGTTGSGNWPTTKPTQAAKNGADDAVVVKVSPSGNSVLFSTYLGGRESDSGMGVAVGTGGTVHVVGLTASGDFPQVKPLQGSRTPAGGDAFVATLSLADVAPAPEAAAAPAASASSGHDRRVRALGAVTLGLLLAAGLQTVYLRRRGPGASTPRPGAKPSAPGTRPPAKATAPSGLRVLDDAGIGAAPLGPGASRGGTAVKAGPASKAGGASKSTRTPKTRGGPKTGAGAAKTGVPAKKSGPPAMPATPATAAPSGPKPRPQEPAIAQLLEEDLWAPDPPAGTPVAEVAAPEAPAPEPAAVPPAAGPPAGPTPDVALPVVPPVPAEELSFWDLFPEDLPPARPAAFPADDLLADHLALPDGPESVAGQHRDDRPQAGTPGTPGTPSAPTRPTRPARPPDAEIVIAELLDGPLPTGPRAHAADWEWSPQPAGDDIIISDLLADEAASARAAARPDEEARIAADQARRRRTRRGGGGRRGRPDGG